MTGPAAGSAGVPAKNAEAIDVRLVYNRPKTETPMQITSILRRLSVPMMFAFGCALLTQPALGAKKKKADKTEAAAPAADPAAAAPAAPAAAPEEEENLEDLPNPEKFCKKDVESHCAKVTFGNNQIASCLRNAREQVSEPCRKALYDYLKKRFERACKKDVKKHCQKESTQQGGLMPCLQKNAAALSAECQEMIGAKPPAAATPAK